MLDTAPGATVDVSVPLTSPSSAGAYGGNWQLRDNQGVNVNQGFVWVRINVVAPSGGSGGGGGGGHIAGFSANPPSPSGAGPVLFHAQVTWWQQYRAMRVLVDGQAIGETSESDHTFTWDTSSVGSGDHSIRLQVASQTDTSWSQPEEQVLTYTFQGGSGSTNHAPNTPSLVANPAYDWYVTIGSPPQLCAQTTDPDPGDSVQYDFLATASVGTYDSGWVGNCFTFPSVTPGTYAWQARARDNHGAVSGWSGTWHFTVESSGVAINDPTINPGSPSNADRVDFCLTTSGHAGVNIDVVALANTANDGSATGQWNYLDGYLPGIGQHCWWLNTLGYGDGPHQIQFNARAWQPAASDVKTITYTLLHRRPASPQLLAPVPASGKLRDAIYLNSRTVAFSWAPTLRATGYTLSVGTNPSPKDDPNPVARQTFDGNTTQATFTLGQDYGVLYWQVVAADDAGSDASGDQLFGIDRVAPSCTVQPLPATTLDTVYQVTWNGTDDRSGVRTYDVQYLDATGGSWSNWLTGLPAPTTYQLFTAQAGHSYSFRCRATDNANNTGAFPANADTSTKVDPTARSTGAWWNPAYGFKRNLTVLNNMSAVSLPAGYPVHLHLDGTTTPTAADLYSAFQSANKCDDLRIVANDSTELDRLVANCSSSAIDIWYRSQTSVAAGASDSTTHQLYFGNAGAAPPPADPNHVWYPYKDAGTAALYFFQEGSGSTAHDAAGNGHDCSIDPSVQWTTAKFGNGLHFSHANGGNSRSLTCSPAVLTSFTVELWYRPDPAGDGRIAGQLVGGGNGGGGNNWLININDGHLAFQAWCSPTCGASGVQSSFNLHDAAYSGKWNYLAVTFDGQSTVKFYINGVLDSTQQLSSSGINTSSPPQEIGSVEGINQIQGDMGTFRISRGVKTSFPYAAFTAISNEPSVAAGSQTVQQTGTPSLAVKSLNLYPNADGTTAAVVVVANVGQASTVDSFATDVYVDHQPTGPGDVTGSVGRWNLGSLAPGQIAMLTANVTLPQGGSGQTNHRMYAQADSTAVLARFDQMSQSIFGPVTACTAAPDAYEPDDTPATAKPITTDGVAQHHNFHSPGDQDWVSFTAAAGGAFVIGATYVGDSVHTNLTVFAPDGTTILATANDLGSGPAPKLIWSAPGGGTYFLRVTPSSSSASGCGSSYDLAVSGAKQASITGVQFGSAGKALHMTVQGSGFGAAPITMPFTGDIAVLRFTDVTQQGWSAGYTGNPVTLNYLSWSDSQIQIGGFAGGYGRNGAAVAAGDTVAISLLDAQGHAAASWQGALPVMAQRTPAPAVTPVPTATRTAVPQVTPVVTPGRTPAPRAAPKQ